jgi:hypothetical protein
VVSVLVAAAVVPPPPPQAASNEVINKLAAMRFFLRTGLRCESMVQGVALLGLLFIGRILSFRRASHSA